MMHLGRIIAVCLLGWGSSAAARDPGVVRSLHIGMTWREANAVLDLPSIEEVGRRLHQRKGTMTWKEKGIVFADSPGGFGNITLHLAESRCRRVFPDLATPERAQLTAGGGRGLCVFTFSKTGREAPYRLSMVSLHFDRADRDTLSSVYIEEYGPPTGGAFGIEAPTWWRLRKGNEQYELRVEFSATPGLYRFELVYPDLHRGGARYRGDDAASKGAPKQAPETSPLPH